MFCKNPFLAIIQHDNSGRDCDCVSRSFKAVLMQKVPFGIKGYIQHPGGMWGLYVRSWDESSLLSLVPTLKLYQRLFFCWVRDVWEQATLKAV